MKKWAEFNQETLILASDGSVLHNDATQAWVLHGTSTESRAYGHGPVPGSGQLLTSLHAEIGVFVSGMLALSQVLAHVCMLVTQCLCHGAPMPGWHHYVAQIHHWPRLESLD